MIPLPPFIPLTKSRKWRNMATAFMNVTMKNRLMSDLVGCIEEVTAIWTWAKTLDSNIRMFGEYRCCSTPRVCIVVANYLASASHILHCGRWR